MHFSSSLAFSENPSFSSNHRCFIYFYPLHSLHPVHGFASNFQPYDVQKMCKNVQSAIRSIPFRFRQGSGQLSKRNSRPARIKAQRAAVLFLSHRSHTAVQHAAHAKGRLDADTSVPCKEQQGIRQLRMEPVQSIIQPKRPSKAWHHVSF